MSAPTMSREQAQHRFDELRTASGLVDDAELDAIWAALETVRPEEIFGAWQGGEFTTGHPANGMLDKANWFGKTFTSRTDVQPLICRGEDGKLFSDKKLGKGEASLWSIEFRGEITASMVYDGQAVIDHFKRVGPSTLMGIMNGKAGVVDGRHLYFYLDRV